MVIDAANSRNGNDVTEYTAKNVQHNKWGTMLDIYDYLSPDLSSWQLVSIAFAQNNRIYFGYISNGSEKIPQHQQYITTTVAFAWVVNQLSSLKS